MTQSFAQKERPTWLEGASAMAGLIRNFDWGTTPLGNIDTWPSCLTTVVAVMLHSRQPMFLWWGPSLIQIYNDAYVPSFGVGKHPAALGQPGKECWREIWPTIGPQIDDVRAEGKACWYEDALVPIFRNGAIEDVYWTYGYSPVFSEGGQIAGVLVICNETTARVQSAASEEAAHNLLQLERARLIRFLAQAPAGICLLRGPDFVFEFANEPYERLVGRTELIGKPLLVALPELEGQGFDRLLRQVCENREVFVGREVPVMLALEGGDPESLVQIYCTFIYSPILDETGKCEGVSVFALDVTSQVTARQEVEALAARAQKSEGELRTLAESIPQLAWSARPDGFIDWYNRRWYDYTGTELRTTEGWGWQTVHDPTFVDDVMQRWQHSLATGENFEMEFPLRRADGVFRWHLTRAVPFRDASGVVTRWFGTDIDDAKRLEAEHRVSLATAQRERKNAEIANRAKDEFLTTASHELRTPLSAILGWARLLRGGQLDQSGYLRGVETIERNAKAQVRLIEDILDGSRIITGKLRLEIKPLDLTQVVRAALEGVRLAADAKSISVSTELEPEAAHVVGDPERLQQVVWNLCNNAIKFTPKGGTLHVRLRQLGTDIELEVRDNGQGIEPEFLPHVFERFRQAEGSTTRRYGGLGLGLALVRHLVEAHGGTVRAESAGLGHGSTFKVRLPLQAVFTPELDSVRPSPLPASDPAATQMNLAGVSVLVVDDENDVRDLVVTVLRGGGANVTSATSAVQAMGELANAIPTVMVSDVGMPEIDGYELIRKVRTELGSIGAALPAIALTAYAREEDRRLALAAGFNMHVAKPVEPSELLSIVANAAAMAQSQHPAAAPNSNVRRADAAVKLERLLHTRGIRDVLQFLNSRTAYRFTGLYRFDGHMRRNLQLFDADSPDVRRGDDVPTSHTYCCIVGQSKLAFTTDDAAKDARLQSHPARKDIGSYCGVLLCDADGNAFGTLCHFDALPCDVPVRELPLMETAARLIMLELSR